MSGRSRASVSASFASVRLASLVQFEPLACPLHDFLIGEAEFGRRLLTLHRRSEVPAFGVGGGEVVEAEADVPPFGQSTRFGRILDGLLAVPHTVFRAGGENPGE